LANSRLTQNRVAIKFHNLRIATPVPPRAGSFLGEGACAHYSSVMFRTTIGPEGKS
jgi:hypothetical protein